MQDFSRTSPPSRSPSPRRRKKQGSNAVFFLFLLLFPTVCAGALGFVLYRAGYIQTRFSSRLTATVVAQKNASCRALIEKAMEVSNTSCSSIDSNKACYGNNTIQADLAPGTAQKFSARGDIVDVDKVRRLSASPLKLDSNEWGVAVLKVIANLPRSLPGQTVTMIVFGNTTLDKEGGNLESFFFSSELGQIVCEKLPNDGIMISVPDGAGVRFTVNGAELTLTGDATIKAVKNGKMEISLLKGSGRIVSDGQEQYFGAGQQVDVQLGGPNGDESVGPPSAPGPLSQDDLDTACALTGQFCSQDQITPVAGAQAQESIQQALGITPTKTVTNAFTSTVTRTPTRTPSVTTTGTILLIPSWTPSRTPTRTLTSALVNPATRTRTRTPTRTVAPGGPAVTPSRTSTATTTSTSTMTSTVTQTSTPTSTPTSTLTPTITPTITSTPDPWSDPACSGSQATVGTLADSTTYLTLDLTNNSPGTIRIDAMRVNWNVGTATQMQGEFLGGTAAANQIAASFDLSSPSIFPAPNPFTGPAGRRDIASAATSTLYLNFQAAPTGSGYTVNVHFDIGCQVSASK